MLTAADKQLAELKEEFGDRWDLWFVPNAVSNTTTWCARPKPLLNEYSPEHLKEEIERVEKVRFIRPNED